MMNNPASLDVTLLGTGTSTGVPVIGCDCRVCTSEDPRDVRTRTSCWIRVNGLSIVIDTGPDFRLQALREDIRRIDAVLYTHHHFDHVMGIDDLRPFLFDRVGPMPCFAHEDTVRVMHRMFQYIFADGSYPGVPNLRLNPVDAPFRVRGRYEPDASVLVTPIDVHHGKMPLFGYRIGDFAYITDTNRIPDSSLAKLQGVRVLVVDALRHEPHPTHFSISEAVDAAQTIGADQTYFIHMTHTVLHEEVNRNLPAGIELGYDGLAFRV